MNGSSATRLAVFFTGGTIAMAFDPERGGAVPRFSGRELLEHIGALGTSSQLDVVEFGRFPGPHMTPSRMLELAKAVAARLADPTVDGVVITHGTDTLEETAFLLSELLPVAKPVVLVGAMRNSSEPSWDGPLNLRSALRVAADPQARGRGVMVVLGETILSGVDAIKTHTESVDTFQSRDFGPLGFVDRDRVIWGRALTPSASGWELKLEERVDLIAVAAGSDGRFINFAVDQGARGLVISGLGRGNVPPAVVPAIQRACAVGIPVVVASRCWRGHVLDCYAYEGAGRQLTEIGCVLAGQLPAHKARLRLMICLGNGLTLTQIRERFEAV